MRILVTVYLVGAVPGVLYGAYKILVAGGGDGWGRLAGLVSIVLSLSWPVSIPYLAYKRFF